MQGISITEHVLEGYITPDLTIREIKTYLGGPRDRGIKSARSLDYLTAASGVVSILAFGNMLDKPSSACGYARCFFFHSLIGPSYLS